MEEKYANSIKLNMGFYDFTTTFVKETMVDNGENNNETIKEDVAIIRMTPQLMKLFHKLLGDNIINYEKTFGEIPTPPDILISNSDQK